MSLQQIYNDDAISKVLKIKTLIDSANDFNSNQMYEYTINKMLSSDIAIDDMTTTQLHTFQTELIRAFKFKNWAN